MGDNDFNFHCGVIKHYARGLTKFLIEFPGIMDEYLCLVFVVNIYSAQLRNSLLLMLRSEASIIYES